MGTYKETYIGPYITVRDRQSSIDIPMRQCQTQTCKNLHKDIITNFCPECGQVPIQFVYSKPSIVTVTDLINFNDDLIEPCSDLFEGHTILIPNNSTGRSIRFNTDIPGIIPLDNHKMLEDLAWFNLKFKDYIIKIYEEFNIENVDIEWGILIYYN